MIMLLLTVLVAVITNVPCWFIRHFAVIGMSA